MDDKEKIFQGDSDSRQTGKTVGVPKAPAFGSVINIDDRSDEEKAAKAEQIREETRMMKWKRWEERAFLGVVALFIGLIIGFALGAWLL